MTSVTDYASLAGSKLRRQRGAQLRESVSAPVSTFARQQLERMGWKDGTGLGKKCDGVTTHITVKQRPDHAGLGSCSKKQVEANSEWWKDSLGDALAKLGGGKKGKKRKKTFTDEDLFQATGGARFGMRAGKTRNQGKWKRTEEVEVVEVEDVTHPPLAKKKRRNDSDTETLTKEERRAKKKLKKEKKKLKKSK